MGELQFEAMIEDLKKAQKFIFLEYYILSKGYLWDKIHAILKEKAAEGVEVRLLYDDFGSILSSQFDKNFERRNIQVYRLTGLQQLSRLYIVMNVKIADRRDNRIYGNNCG